MQFVLRRRATFFLLFLVVEGLFFIRIGFFVSLFFLLKK